MRDPVSKNLVTDPYGKAEGFKNQYESVFTQDDGVLPYLRRLENNNPHNQFIITRKMISYELSKLKPHSSPGPDEVHPFVLKTFSKQLSVPLHYILCKSVAEACIPNLWKVAHITPVYKNKGSRYDYVNYRPVSLTSHVSKTMERIMTDWLLDELCKLDFISPHQHGFVASRSVCTNLLACLFDWVDALDKRDNVDVIYLDIAKAFDTVSHVKLFHKLDHLSLPTKLVSWIKDFLSYRYQRVKVGSVLSESSNVTSGVPQGTVIGPILFLIYINDIVDSVTIAKIQIFADDTKLYLRYGRNETSSLQDDLNNVSVWLDTWQLSVSASKCTVLPLALTGHRTCEEYLLNGNPVPICDSSVRDLGVYISSDLVPRYHVNKLTSNAFSRAGLIFKCFKTRDQLFLKRMFNTYVRPLVEFATPVWSPYNLNLIMSVERVQRNFTSKIPNLKHLDYPSRLAALNMDSLELRRLKYDLIELFKMVKGFSVLKFDEYFTYKQVTHTRCCNSLQIFNQGTNSSLALNFFKYRSVKVWNALPENVVQSRNLSIFKTRLNTLDLSQFLKCFPDSYFRT